LVKKWFGGPGWIRQVEHPVLRLVSLAFSFWSAHAIRWIFSPLDGLDSIEPAMIWIVAFSFGLLGFFVSRGLVHRMMHKERIWAYLPICFVVEFVEIVANYSEAASNIQRATWLHTVPVSQQFALTCLTYAMYCVIPFGSLFLAVVDMDIMRAKAGSMAPVMRRSFGPQVNGNGAPVNRSLVVPPATPGQPQGQPQFQGQSQGSWRPFGKVQPQGQPQSAVK